MTLTDSDLSDLLAAVQAGEMTEKIRTSLAWVLQALIEAELTATIGGRPHERSDARLAQRNGHRPKLIATAAGISSWPSRSCGRGRFSRRCWSGAAGSTGPCSRW